MSHLLLIDGNSIGMAAQAAPPLSSNGQPTQAIFNSLRMIRGIIDEYGKATPIVFWDGRSWRHDAFAEYKGTRDDDPKAAAARAEYKAQRPQIGRMLASLGVRQQVASNLEADDLIAKLVYALEGKRPATVVSGDRDLLQLVGPNVEWRNPIGGIHGREPTLKRVRDYDFAEQTGYESSWSFVQGKALLGDTSDNLAGIDGIGKTSAPLVLEHWGDVVSAIKDLRARGEDAIPQHLRRYKKKLLTFANDAEAIGRFKRNVALMHLRPDRFPDAQNARSIASNYQRALFEQQCEELGFASILRDPDTWLRPFERVHGIERMAA